MQPRTAGDLHVCACTLHPSMTEIEPLRRSRGQAEDGVAARQRASLPSSRPSASARDPEASERRGGGAVPPAPRHLGWAGAPPPCAALPLGGGARDRGLPPPD